MMITSKMWLLEHQQGFPLIWPGELIFYIKWPNFILDLEIIKTNILSNIYDDYFKNDSFLLIWPGHLVFDPMWPIFKLDLEIIKTNILSKIHDDCFKNVTARVLTRFSADLARWPSFWHSFKLDLEIKTNMLSKIHDDCLKNVTTRVLTRFSADLARWPSF